MMNPTRLLRIMYAPVDYTVPGHWPHPDLDLHHVPASFANQILISHHRLETRIHFHPPADPILDACLGHWTQLPRICQLIGSKRLQAPLLQEGHYWQLAPICRQFLSLPLPQAGAADLQTGWDAETQCLTAGVNYLMPALWQLPLPLRQRLPLLFPSSMAQQLRTGLEGLPGQPTGIDQSLFSFAVHYALIDQPYLS